jgi:three-Cys-motif partner protein
MCELLAITYLPFPLGRIVPHHSSPHKNHSICFNDVVALPTDTIWKLEPHTGAKHQILGRYLDAWFPILGKYNRKLVYIDGFAGPGCYLDGEPGSPIVALQSALRHKDMLTGQPEFWLIEERPDRVAQLETEISRLTIPINFIIKFECGTFAEKFKSALDTSDRDGTRLAPTFALIDPFGFSGIPYDLIKRVLLRNKCEVLITFMVDSINRWLTHPEEGVRAHIIETFGTSEAIDIAFGGGDRATALKDLYQQQLKKVARFVRYFEMRDRDNRVVYYLFFATSNPLGHVKMKESMWKVDPLGEFRFSDATNPDQQVLFNEPPTAGLAKDLASHFAGKPQMQIAAVEEYVQDDTAYLRKHMGDALKVLEKNGVVAVAEEKADGEKRRAGTYPNNALVLFKSSS